MSSSKQVVASSGVDTVVVGGDKSKFRGRRKAVPHNFYQDDSLSVGGRIKRDGIVVETRNKESKNTLNINCRIESFGLIVNSLDDTKKKWISEMGFDCFLNLGESKLPRSLCYWLATRVDVFHRSLIALDGKVFPLSREQVHCVLGIPMGNKVVPDKVIGINMANLIDSICDKYNTTTEGGTTGITRKTLEEAVKGPAQDALEFKYVFLMLAISDVLCPTTSHRFPIQMLPAVTVAGNCDEYDWCTFVLDDLFRAISSFGKRFYYDGFANGCGGCTIFLAILYLDRLKMLPPKWGLYPRIQAWNVKNINIFKKADMRQSGDFGELGCVDAAYGFRHPMGAKDLVPATAATNTAMTKLKEIIDAELCKEIPAAPVLSSCTRHKRRKTSKLNLSEEMHQSEQEG